MSLVELAAGFNMRTASRGSKPLTAQLACACIILATIAACDPADAHDAPRASARAAAAPTQPVAALPPTLSRLQIELRAIRSRGDEVQVEVGLDRPLPPMATARPQLQVGDEIVRRSRAGADGRVDRLIFTMPAEQFERMPKDRPMIVRAGVFDNASAESKPTLSDVAVIGGAR